MIIPDSEITPLDPRFPIAMTGGIPVFGKLVAEWEDQATVISQARRAGAQAERHEERYVTPAPAARPEPEPRPEPAAETIVDFRLHDDGDRFVREGMPKPDVTDTFLRHYEKADAREQAREQRSPFRRAWRWARGT